VLYCKLRPQAEEKVMAALAAAQEMHYEKRVREETVVDRAPFDQKGNVAERLVQYAKSVNHHVGEGTSIPEKTVKGIQELKAYLEQVAQDPSLSDGERALLEAYRKDLAEVEAACAAYQKTPRKDYDKRVGPWTRKVEELVPVPGQPGGLCATTRDGTRIAPREEGGVAYWDGAARAKGHYGKEIVVDFGDGWQAVYHPHHDDYGVPWSYKGTLELHLPPGADPAGIPEHLERLYVQGRPMTREGAELVYLERNAWALGLTGDLESQAVQARRRRSRSQSGSFFSQESSSTASRESDSSFRDAGCIFSPQNSTVLQVAGRALGPAPAGKFGCRAGPADLSRPSPPSRAG